MKKLLLLLFIPSLCFADYVPVYNIRNIQSGKDNFRNFAIDENFNDTYNKLSIMVDKYSDQTIEGTKTFSAPIVANGGINSTVTSTFTAITATSINTGGKHWEIIASTVIGGSALTDYTFSGLNGNADNEYRIVFRVVNTAGSASDYYVYPNGTAVGTALQRITANNTTITAARTSGGGLPIAAAGASGYIGYGDWYFYAKTGFERIGYCAATEWVTGSTVTSFTSYGLAWSDTTTNITSLQIHGTVASSIGMGSTIVLWALR